MIIPWRYCRISLIGLLTHIEEDKAGLRRLGSLGRLTTTTRCVMASLPQRPPRRLTLPGEDPDLNVYLSPPPPGHQWCVQDTQWGVGVCGPDVATKKTVTFSIGQSATTLFGLVRQMWVALWNFIGIAGSVIFQNWAMDCYFRHCDFNFFVHLL